MKKIDPNIIQSVKQLLCTDGLKVVIVPHVSPDGDAIGSSLGFATILKNYGCSVQVVVPNSYPDFYRWMKGSEQVLVYTKEPGRCREVFQEAGLLVCLDFNQIARTGELQSLIAGFEKPRLLIDHHPFPDSFADYTISHPECSSTAELLFHVVKALEFTGAVDQAAAECLFCGIMTDTGSFDYNVSDPQTFQTVSELITWGVDPVKIHDVVFDNYSVHRMQLLGHLLCECMTVFPEYHAAVMYLTRETKEKFHFASGDSEGFVNYPLSIKGIHFSAMFTEKKDYVKASFRSKGSFPVNLFASENFNGGGHRNAAGGEINASLAETLDKFQKLLPVYQKMLND